MNEYEKAASEKVMQLLTANWINHAIYAAAKIGIADILSGGPKTVGEIAGITDTNEHILYRLMRALASVDFFHEEEERVFCLRPMGEMLQKEKMQPIVLMFLAEWHNRAWTGLLDSVKTGSIPFDSAFGMPCFEWFKENRDAADVFNKANQIKAAASHVEITRVWDFSGIESVVDVGGGYGGLLFHLLRAHPDMNGIIADLAYMAEDARMRISSAGLDARCAFAECDFFEQIPEGGDCYILSNILHDWDDAECRMILKNCRDAMKPDAKLLIVEALIPGGSGFSIAKLLDLEVLVMGGGRERTELEFRRLLEVSGFTIEEIFETDESISVIVCTKK